MFGRRLKEVRKERGYTLEELADIYNKKFDAGLNKGTLSKYENGKQEPMITVATNLATILNVPSDYLLGITSNNSINIKEKVYQKQLLSSFNKLNDDNKKKAITYTENLLKIEEMENEHLLVKAAHNDFAEDEKEQKLMQEDMDEL